MLGDGGMDGGGYPTGSPRSTSSHDIAEIGKAKPEHLPRRRGDAEKTGNAYRGWTRIRNRALESRNRGSRKARRKTAGLLFSGLPQFDPDNRERMNYPISSLKFSSNP